MIGRGALGNPWLFNEIKSYYLTGSQLSISFRERREVMLNHLNRLISERGEERGIKEMRAHLCYYTKGIKGGNKIRQMINQCSDIAQLTEILGGLNE